MVKILSPNKKKEEKITFIKNIEKDTTVSTDLPLIDIKDKNDTKEVILDLSISLQHRLNTLELFYNTYGNEETLEIVNKLNTMYQFSGTKSLEEYLFEICTNSNINPMLKLSSAKSLCYFNEEQEIGYKALDIVCKNLGDVPSPCKIESVIILMKHKDYKLNSRNYFCNIINDQKIECDYRYKSILSLENAAIKSKQKTYFLTESCLEFLFNSKNRTMYRILAGQYLMQKCKIQNEKIEITLMSFAQDPELDYDLRADAADVILRLGTDSYKKIAREIIMMLGRHEGNTRTVFDNAQNVHTTEIEDSVIEILEVLSSIPLMAIENSPITYEYVKKQIDDILEKENPYPKIPPKTKTNKLLQYKEKLDKIGISLNRIYLDRALYSKYNCSLLNILLKMWSYIQLHKHKEEMIKRLIEELVDMSGTCSTGFASRLVNVISGFGEFNVRISWEDQIVANFTGRLNAIIKLIENEDYMDKILEEMTINCNDYSKRPNFLKFFRQNMLSIREELYEEFKEHINDTDFDLYFRKALSSYDGI